MKRRAEAGRIGESGESGVLAGVSAEGDIAAGVADRLELDETEPALVEEGEFIGVQVGYRTAGVGWPGAHSWVLLRKTEGDKRNGNSCNSMNRSHWVLRVEIQSIDGI